MKARYARLAFGIIGTIGIVCACCMLSTAYEASCGFYYGLQSRMMVDDEGSLVGDEYVEQPEERFRRWRSAHVKDMAIEIFRNKNPDVSVSGEELYRVIELSQLELEREGRHAFCVRVCSRQREVCAGLANAYVDAICSYTEDENKIRTDKALVQINAYAAHSQRVVEKIRQSLAELGEPEESSSAKIELETRLSKEMMRLEELRKKEAETRKLAETRNMTVVIAWRAVVSRRYLWADLWL